MNDISRRTLLKQFVLAGLLGAWPAWLRPTSAGAGTDSEPLAARLLDCLSRPASARRLGERYLAQARREADVSYLCAHIAGSRWRARAFAVADRQTLRLLLAEQQRNDFAAARIVNLDGWVLSHTEARLCALAAVAQRQA